MDKLEKKVKTAELFENVPDFLSDFFDAHEYPWQILKDIPAIIEKAAKSGKFTEIKPGIYVGERVTIAESATLIAPVIIGDDTEIRPSAYIRGNVIIGARCVIGNSSEMKNCILCGKVQIPHYNYVGDSVLGYGVHLGAGSICSNLKSGGTSVTVHAEEDLPTGLRKCGAMLADGVDVGSGCVLNPGTVIGKNTNVYPLTALRGVYPENCIVKSQTEIVKRR